MLSFVIEYALYKRLKTQDVQKVQKRIEMFDKLDFITEKYQELSTKVADPAVIADQNTWQKYMKEMAELEPVVKAYDDYRRMQSDLADAREIIDMEDDEEMREMAKEEARELEDKMERLRRSSRFFCCLRTLTMTRTSYSRSGQAPAEKKRLSSGTTC